MLNLLNLFTAEEVYAFGQHPFRRCEDCGGDGFLGAAAVFTPEGLCLIPVMCPLCMGTGEHMYMTTN